MATPDCGAEFRRGRERDYIPICRMDITVFLEMPFPYGFFQITLLRATLA
jgi:hypothetical protein